MTVMMRRGRKIDVAVDAMEKGIGLKVGDLHELLKKV
jgi:hypothetical protein